MGAVPVPHSPVVTRNDGDGTPEKVVKSRCTHAGKKEVVAMLLETTRGEREPSGWLADADGGGRDTSIATVGAVADDTDLPAAMGCGDGGGGGRCEEECVEGA